MILVLTREQRRIKHDSAHTATAAHRRVSLSLEKPPGSTEVSCRNCSYHDMTDSLYCSGHHLVRVRAQVMMREDSTGGWVPLGGGGLSHVALRKRKIHHEDDPPCKHEYVISGKRINDQKVSVLRAGRMASNVICSAGDELHDKTRFSIQPSDANLSSLENGKPQVRSDLPDSS